MTAEFNKPARRRRAPALLLVVVRLVALLLSVGLGGIAHDVTDLVAAVADVRHEEEQCPLDGPCNDCPAGCPNCHCPNALGAVAPAASPAALIDPTAALAAAPRLTRGRAFDGPDLPSIYRPPRGAARS